jgi:putative sigma-54 modulation protein
MEIKITGRGVKVTDPIRNKVKDMLSKHENFLKKATKIEVVLKESIAHEGVEHDLKVEITAHLPNAFVRVEESGSDYYTIIDIIDPVFRRRLVRYQDHSSKWEGTESWRVFDQQQFEKVVNEEDVDDPYSDNMEYTPAITRYKQFSQNSPMHPSEAIERMELLGHEAFLFRNIETDKYAVVYRRRDDTYGLLEPKEG